MHPLKFIIGDNKDKEKKRRTYSNASRWNISQCLYTKATALPCFSARRIPSIIEAWFSASENMAILSFLEGLPPANSEPTFPTAVIKAMLAERPVGQRRQS